MLTLTRKVGETIRIGNEIQIVVKEIRKNQVRIGIVAPRDVKIFREEVYINIVRENEESASVDLDQLDGVTPDLPTIRADAEEAPQDNRPGRSNADPGQEAGSND